MLVNSPPSKDPESGRRWEFGLAINECFWIGDAELKFSQNWTWKNRNHQPCRLKAISLQPHVLKCLTFPNRSCCLAFATYAHDLYTDSDSASSLWTNQKTSSLPKQGKIINLLCLSFLGYFFPSLKSSRHTRCCSTSESWAFHHKSSKTVDQSDTK